MIATGSMQARIDLYIHYLANFAYHNNSRISSHHSAIAEQIDDKPKKQGSFSS